MKQCIVPIIFILAISCKTKSVKWQTIDFGTFRLKAPNTWTMFKEQGVDSYVGGITNGKDSLWFDYGWYSSEIDDGASALHLYGQGTINGLIAVVQIPKVDGHGSIRLSIPHVNANDKFDLGGHDIKGTDAILEIFKSIVFKESDTALNSDLTISKFKNFPFGSGRTLYYFYCSGCHHPTRFMGAAPLKQIVEERQSDWIYNFFSNRKSIVTDSLYKARVKESAGMTCPEFSNLTKDDIRQIISYVKGH